MESAFTWIAEIWATFTSFIPHLDNMESHSRGVKFKHGKEYEVEPGLYWWLPATTNVETLEVVRQTVRLDTQTLTTKDDQTISVAAVIVYEINDIIKAVAKTEDLEDVVSDVAQFSVVKAIQGREYHEILSDLAEQIPAELKEQCRKDLKQFGVLVKDAFLSDCAYCKVHRIMGDGGLIPEEASE